MKTGYLGRLIARATPPAVRVVSPAPVADPFEAVEEGAPVVPPSAPPAALSSARIPIEPSEPPAPAMAPAITDLPLTQTHPEREPILIQPELRVDRETRPLAASIVPTPSPAPPARESVEKSNESVDRKPLRIEPIGSVPVPQRLEPSPSPETERVIERTERVETTEQIVPQFLPESRIAKRAEPVLLQPVAQASPALVRPQPLPPADLSAPLGEEPPSLVIGRLTIDVVPVSAPAQPPQTRTRVVRASSRSQSSAESYFGIGQI